MILIDYNLGIKQYKKSKYYNESKILRDKQLNEIKDYLESINLDYYPGNSNVEINDIIDKNKEFFEKYLPLQKILASSKEGLPHEVNPFEIVDISNDEGRSMAHPYIVANMFGKRTS